MTSRRRENGDARARRDGITFAPMPSVVLNSTQYAALSAPSVKLLVDLAAQFNGHNNGHLAAAWTVMEKRGWRSRDTLGKAMAELLRAGFVVQTRQGGRHAASLYGITFHALDSTERLDVRERDFPRGAWARTVPLSRGKKEPTKVTDTPIVAPSIPIDTPGVLANAPTRSINTPIVSVPALSALSVTRRACTS